MPCRVRRCRWHARQHARRPDRYEAAVSKVSRIQAISARAMASMAYLSSIPQRVRESARGGGRPLPADDPCDGRDEDDSMTVIMPDGPFGASTLPKAPLYAASRIGAAERLMRREVQRSERQSVWPRQQKPTGIPASRYHQKLIGNLPARSQPVG
jgi:hypothetical protein